MRWTESARLAPPRRRDVVRPRVWATRIGRGESAMINPLENS